MIAAHREPDRKRGRELMQQLIDSIGHSVPTALLEVVTLGRILRRRAVDVLAFFDRPVTSIGPTGAINGRLEHLRGLALGFLNLTNYVPRSLLATGGFRPQLQPRLWRAAQVLHIGPGDGPEEVGATNQLWSARMVRICAGRRPLEVRNLCLRYEPVASSAAIWLGPAAPLFQLALAHISCLGPKALVGERSDTVRRHHHHR